MDAKKLSLVADRATAPGEAEPREHRTSTRP